MDSPLRRNPVVRESPTDASSADNPSAVVSVAKKRVSGSASHPEPISAAAENAIRSLTLTDQGTAATTLADVLKNNPIVRYLIDTDDYADKSMEEKDEILAKSMQYILHAIIAV